MSSHLSSNKKAGCVVGCLVIAAAVLIAIVVMVKVSEHSGMPGYSGPQQPAASRPSGAAPTQAAPALNPVLRVLQPPAGVARSEGVAIALLMDTSGSMNSRPKNGGEVKIVAARASAVEVVRKAEAFAKAHANKKVLLGVYEFSVRNHEALCRNVMPLQAPDAAAAAARVAAMKPLGGTPIGDAIIAAQRDLDATGLTREHIIVVTDGESNHGYAPVDVLNAISNLEEPWRAAVYFVAFDVDAGVFTPLREAGGLVLPAANAQELQGALDYILSGKILVEQPAAPAAGEKK